MGVVKRKSYFIFLLFVVLLTIGGFFFQKWISQAYWFNRSALAFINNNIDGAVAFAKRGEQVQIKTQAVQDYHSYKLNQDYSKLQDAFHKHPTSFHYLMQYTEQSIAGREWYKVKPYFYSLRWARYLSAQGRSIAQESDDAIAYRGLFYMLFAKKISEDPRISHDLGSVLAFRHQSMEKAEVLLMDALLKENRNPLYYRTLGRLHAQRNPFLAISFYECARRMDPGFYTTYINIGRIYFNEKKYTQAHDWFDRAKKIDPKRENAYFEKARIFIANEEIEKAHMEYRSIVKLIPGAWRPRYQWGVFLFRQKEFEQAVTQLTLTLTFNPDYFWAYFYRSSAYFQLQDYSNAMLDVEKALSINPDNVSADRLYQRIKNEIINS